MCWSNSILTAAASALSIMFEMDLEDWALLGHLWGSTLWVEDGRYKITVYTGVGGCFREARVRPLKKSKPKILAVDWMGRIYQDDLSFLWKKEKKKKKKKTPS